MRILLTSFGITKDIPLPIEESSIFYRMPPVYMREIGGQFILDYSALILNDKIIMDEISFQRIAEKPSKSYENIAEAIITLHKEGYIELVNYEDILLKNESLLAKMLDNDLISSEQWLGPLNESLNMWKNFVVNIDPEFFEKIDMDITEVYGSHLSTIDDFSDSKLLAATQDTFWKEMLNSPSIDRLKKSYLKDQRKLLKVYLRYVNANLILSNHLNVGFFDWADFKPFYRKKFLAVGKNEIPEYKSIEQSHKLFEISFPELKIANVNSLIKTLKDNRVKELRDLVTEAVKGNIDFDTEFARRIFSEIFSIEQRASRYRTILSYLTLPVGFIPLLGTIAQKLLEESIGTLLEKKVKEKYGWFYMLSDRSWE